MHRLLILALFAFPLSALGQSFSASALDAPILPDRTPLAASVDVPFPLLLGLDGVTPLFVNPARAARADRRFVFGTVGQLDAGPTPVSVAALLGNRDGRWLVTARNAVSTQDVSRAETRTMRDDVDPDRTSSNEVENRDDLLDANVDTQARVSFVGRTDYGGYAVGLFGGYRTNSRERRNALNATSIDERFFSTFTDVRTVERTDDRFADIDRADFGIGAEVAFAGQRWDAVASLSYQGQTASDRISEQRVDRINSEQNYDDGRQFSDLFSARREVDTSLDISPSGVALEALGTIRTSRHRDDYLFGAVSGFYAGGEVDAMFATELIERTRINNNGEVSEQEDTISDEAAGVADLDTQLTKVALGYVYARQKRGLIVLAGVSPSGRIERRDFVDVAISSSIESRLLEIEAFTLTVDLPLHVQVPMSRTLALFGGGVYRYSFLDRTTTEGRPLDTTSTLPDDPFDEEQSFEINQQSVSSSNRLYGGAIFRHRSGLTAQAAFRGDLAQFSGWTVSLGYRF